MNKANMKNPTTVGLYIHIPFCKSKCPYCDFASYTGMEAFAEAYISAVIKEASKYKGYMADSVFIGGGTPSCLKNGLLKKLTDGIRQYIDIEKNCEFSIEANPNSFDDSKAEEFLSCGCNRISFGLQTASDRLLKVIGRIHTKNDFENAVNTAFSAGFSNINADIMYSLPSQKTEDIRETLNFLKAFPLKHISAYSLIIEEGTKFYDLYESGKLDLPSEDEDRESTALISEMLNSLGYKRYEISNYSIPGFECKHNLKYWNREEYIGLGVSAHSFIKEKRFGNTKSIEEYISKINSDNDAVDYVDADVEPAFENLMLKTRIKSGIELSYFSEQADSIIQQFIYDGFAEINSKGNFSLTDKGMDIQDAIVLKLSDFLK